MARRNNDEVKDQVSKTFSNAKSSLKKGISAITGKGALKKGQMTRNLMKGLKLIAKALFLIIKMIILLIMQLWWVILPVIIIGCLVAWISSIIYNEVAENGLYGVSNTIKSEDAETSLENSVSLLFYTKYSTHSYYYTVDNDTTLYQATPNQEIKDFEGRDTMFALNPGSLYILDKYLNNGFIDPAPFIRPVYNTCSTGEDAGGACETKALTEDGLLVAESVKYEETVSNDGVAYYKKVEDETEPGVWNWGLASILHYKKFDQESEVQNYHTEDFEYFDEKTRTVKTMSMADYNSLSEKEKEEMRAKFKDVTDRIENTPATVRRGEDEDNGTIPENDTAYAVDNVASMFGTITNSLSLEWVFQNEYVNTSVPVDWEKWLPLKDETELKSENLLKKVTSGWTSVEGYQIKVEVTKNYKLTTSQEQICKKRAIEAKGEANAANKSEKKQQEAYDKAYKKCKNSYSIKEGFEILDDKTGEWVFFEGTPTKENVQVLYKEELTITRQGQLMKHTVSYDDDEPNLSETSGLQYLKDYIGNYVNYVKSEEGKASLTSEKYYCYPIQNAALYEAADAANSEYQEMINKVTSLTSFKLLTDSIIKTEGNANVVVTDTQSSEIIDTGYGGVKATIIEKVSKATDCAKNSVAIKVSDTLMTEMYAENLPDVQALTIMKEMGYNPNSTGYSITGTNALGYETITEAGISLSTQNDTTVGENTASEQIKTKYKDQVARAAKEYGLDTNLLYAIIDVTSGGDENYSSDKCESTGCGLMGVKTREFDIGQNLKAYNFIKNDWVKYSDVKKGDGDYLDPENNIIYGAMLLQRYMQEYEYNQLMAIQAYSYGKDNMESLLTAYTTGSGATKAQAIADEGTYEWTSYRKYCAEHAETCFGKKTAPGNATFAEQILASMGTISVITVRNQDNDYFNFDFTFLKDISVDSTKSKTVAMNNRIMALFKRKGGDAYWSKNWDIIYAGQKDYTDGIYSEEYDPTTATNTTQAALTDNSISTILPDEAEKVEYRYRDSTVDVNSVIGTMFGFTENTSTETYQNLSDEFWKTRYAAMFKTAGSKAWVSTYDVSHTFNGGVALPVKGEDSISVIDTFGWAFREGNVYSYSPTTTILATKGASVVAMASAEVTEVVKEGDEYVISFLHNDGSGKQATDSETADTDTEKEEEEEIISTGATSMTGLWKDVKTMGYTKEEVVQILTEKFTNLKPNGALKNKAQYFVDYCETKNVNPFLVAAISAVETGWGESELAINANNFGGMEANHKDAIASYDGRFGVFKDVETGIRAHIDLLADHYITVGLYLPSTMAAKYCEGSSSWVTSVNSVFSTLSGHIMEEATQAKRETVKKVVSYTYYGLGSTTLKVGDVVRAGDTVGLGGNSNHLRIAFVDDGKGTDVSAVFEAIENSRAREKAFLSVGGIIGANNIGVDITTDSFTKKNPFGYVGQCTWYVWGRVNQVTDKSIPQWGNAQDWCSGARASGYKTGVNPSANAIVVWYSGAYGHVAFVEELTKDGTVTISEGNYNNPCAYSANNCDMVDYAQRYPGSLLHKATMSSSAVNTYNGMTLACYIYTD